MSVLATTLISEVQQKFEGGNSLSVDWDMLTQEAMENVLDNCRPATLKKKVPIYGGLAQDLRRYYAPSDILIPCDLYDNEGQMLAGDAGERKFSYLPPKQYYAKRLNKTYTIEYLNGIRYILAQYATNAAYLTVDTMDAVGTISGGTPTLNEHNFLTGTGAIQAIFTDVGVEMGDTLASALDISDYLKGIALVPSYLSTAANIASVELRLKTDDSNYYSVISTSDSIGDYFSDGWNMARFNLANATQTGSPDSANIAKWSVVITTTSGNTETVIIDKITIQKSEVFYLEYYTTNMFINGTTGAWQSTVSYVNNDLINVDRDVAGILRYELCILIEQASTQSNPKEDFRAQLQRKYNAYFAVHPSDEAPLTYSISPEINRFSDEELFGNLQDDTVSLT